MRQGITVVGLGSGDENQLSLAVWNTLKNSANIVLRTKHHPVAEMLDREGIRYDSFDSLYETFSTFAEVYEAIVENLLERAESGEWVYAVPGHPMVAESTVHMLKERAAQKGISVRVMGGVSFLDQVFLRLGFDPAEGFQLLDGSQFTAAAVNPTLNTVICQVYDKFTASDVKLGLMEIFPDDYEVTVAHGLGMQGEEIRKVPLYELDRLSGYGNYSLIYVPRTSDERVLGRTFNRLRDIVRILRSPEGCPWDREQTHQSIRKNFLEEVYEVLETIDDDDPDAMCEELGDVLLQVMLHAQMEEERGAFHIIDVIAGLNDKLIRRHPHVFGEGKAKNAEEALNSWQRMKMEEKKRKGQANDHSSVLDGVPRSLPGLMKAWEYQKKAAKVGFDWDKLEDVFAKVDEEIGELKQAVRDGSKQECREELGDLLFAVVNVARFLGIDPEEALAGTNRKFLQRFSYIEQQLRLKGKSFDQTSLPEMEEWWQQAKRL